MLGGSLAATTLILKPAPNRLIYSELTSEATIWQRALSYNPWSAAFRLQLIELFCSLKAAPPWPLQPKGRAPLAITDWLDFVGENC